MLDDKYRLFGIINPVDLVVLVGIVAVALVGANVLFGVFKPAAEKKTTEMRFVVLVPEQRQFDVTSIKVGDVVTNTKGGLTLGKVEAVETKPASIENETPDGVRLEESKLLLDVYVTIVGDARVTREGAVFGSVPLRVNRDLSIATKYFEGSGKIVSMTPASR